MLVPTPPNRAVDRLASVHQPLVERSRTRPRSGAADDVRGQERGTRERDGTTTRPAAQEQALHAAAVRDVSSSPAGLLVGEVAPQDEQQ